MAAGDDRDCDFVFDFANRLIFRRVVMLIVLSDRSHGEGWMGKKEAGYDVSVAHLERQCSANERGGWWVITDNSPTPKTVGDILAYDPT